MLLVFKNLVQNHELTSYCIMLDVVTGSIILTETGTIHSDIFCFTNHNPLGIYHEHHLTTDVVDYIESKYFDIVKFYESKGTQAEWEYIFDDIQDSITPYKGLSLDDIIADYVTLPWETRDPNIDYPIIIEYNGYELCIETNTDEHIIYAFAENMYNDLNDNYVIDFYLDDLHQEFIDLQEELIAWVEAHG